MPKNLLIPSVEETAIHLEFKDGQKPLDIDAIDVDGIIMEIRSRPSMNGMDNGVPEGSTFEKEFVALFFQRYQRRISRTVANLLCNVKAEIIQGLKKNWYEQQEQSASTTQEQSSPTENSDSSNMSKKSSKQKKLSKSTP